MIPARMLAFDKAPAEIFTRGEKNLRKFFSGFDFDFSSASPFLLIFLSGGSERSAIESVAKNHFYILLAFEENNSWAAATETKAWMDQNNIDCLLADMNNAGDRTMVSLFLNTITALERLKGKKIGLIGEVSDWLIASDIERDLLVDKLGIRLEKINWNSVPDFKSLDPDPSFLEKYSYKNLGAIIEAAKVQHALSKIREVRQLDALTIECFSLVQTEGVTACLALSYFNDKGIPAGCEGDLVSMVGMMLVQAITGIIPWMANLVKVGSDLVKFAHCTAPTHLLETFDIDTHFETGKGTAVAGKFAGETITVFRLNNSLDKGFLTTGQITAKHQSPEHACRTMIEVKLSSGKINQLKNHPLGNHHLIVPGNQCETLEMACRIMGVKLIK
ncbi:MAG: hypothetical protein IH598_14600 [Bacteroidales bacterium]|nr:hypothetical protein [Bacteroidales bacterium]